MSLPDNRLGHMCAPHTHENPDACGVLVAVICLCWAAPWIATAQDSTYVLPQLTVTASRIHTSPLYVPMRLTVLDAGQAPTVADLLSGHTTLYIRRYGSGLASMSQRGAGASQTAVLLDGHPIASPQLGQVDLSLLPTIVLSSVEVSSGTGAPVFGAGAMAGVVNLRTNTSHTGTEIRASTGAFGRHAGAFTTAAQWSAIHALLAAELYGADDDYEYVNVALFPPRTVTRLGGDRQRSSIYGTLRWEGAERHLRLAGWINKAERGVPSVHTFQQRRERQWDRHARLWAAGERPLGRATLHISGLYQSGMLRYVNPQLQIDDTGHTTVSSLNAEMRIDDRANWQIGAGLSAGYARAAHPRVETHQWRGGAFVSAIGAYGPLRIFPASRLDYYAKHQAINPQLGINIGVASRLHVKASAGRAFRMPTFNDRFWRPGGNPDLLPELGWTYDLGARWQRQGDAIEVSAFLSRYANQIVWQPTTSGYWSPANIERLRSKGLEASVIWHVSATRWLDIRMRSVITSTHSRNGPQIVRLVAGRQFKSHIKAIAGPVTFGLSALSVSKRAVTIDDSTLLPGFLILSSVLSYQFGSAQTSTTLTLRVDNALDNAYQYIPNSPMPPRTWQLDLVLNLH